MWRLEEQQTGQAVVTNVAGENGEGFRAVEGVELMRCGN